MKTNRLIVKLMLPAFIINALNARQAPAAPQTQAPAIEVWYGLTQSFGRLGTPQRWINIPGTVTAGDGVASLTYSLNQGASRALSLGPDARRLLSEGDFNIELDVLELVEENNTVTITAVDSLGQKTTQHVHVGYSRDRAWPLPYAVEWDSVTSVQNVAQVVDGRWTIGEDGLRPILLGYDRAVAIGDLSWTNYEITAEVIVHGIDTTGFRWPSLHPGFGITLRWQGHTAWDDAQPRWGYTPIGASSWYSWRSKGDLRRTRLSLGGEGPTQIAPAFETLQFETPYYFKMRVQEAAGGGSAYYLKVWQAAAAEPADWLLTYSEGIEDLAAGSVLLVAHHVDVSFGDLRIVPLRDSKDRPSRLRSDSFSAKQLDTAQWTFHDPLQDATLSLTGSQAAITVSAEQSHTVWGTATSPFKYTSPRLMQQANDVNFEIDVKFDSGVSERYQQHGVVIEQDSLNVLRFEFIGDGQSTRIFAASFDNGIAETRRNKIIAGPGMAPLFMRIRRQGYQWTQYFSFDGIRWWPAVTFSHNLAVHAAGVHVGNSEGVAHTAVIDYFRVRSAPQDTVAPAIYNLRIAPEDTAAVISWETDEVASSSLAYSTGGDDPQGLLSSDLLVQSHSYRLTNLQPDTEVRFTIRVQDRYQNVRNSGEHLFRTLADATPPLLRELSLMPERTRALLSWKTSEPAKSVVAYGITEALEMAELREDSLFVNHLMTLSGLEPGTVYHFKITVADKFGNAAESGIRRFRTRMESSPGHSDDFDAPALNTSLWTVIDPLNDATLTMTGRQIAIAVPAETEHVLWGSETTAFANTVPRLMQTIRDIDFEIEVKFDSGVNRKYQQQGLIVARDSTNLLRLEFFGDSENTRIFAASFQEGIAAGKINKIISGPGVAPLYMRIRREASRWSQFYSFDGVDWFTAGSFSHNLNVSLVGIYAANSHGVSHTALIDYFDFRELFTVPVEKIEARSELPRRFRLFANYPNPFNDATVIEFAIPSEKGPLVPVELIIYDYLGRQVAELFKKKTAPGYYRILWEARSDTHHALPSGLYFAVLRMAGQVRTMKMILAK